MNARATTLLVLATAALSRPALADEPAAPPVDSHAQTGANSTVESDAPAAPPVDSHAQTGANSTVKRDDSMHPPFELRDQTGAVLTVENASAATEESCSSCHDTDYILANNSHRERGVKIACLQCHLPGGTASLDAKDFDAEGRLTRPMTPPTCDSCGECHGQVHKDKAFLEIDPAILRGEIPGRFGNSLQTGEIFSPQMVSASFLNLADKADLVHPWDVHAARGVHCVSCHFPPNDPARADLMPRAGPVHLIRDPRSMDLAAYLRRPNHRFATADCTSCHDPGPAHAEFPYPKRHLDALACQACHIPELRGPALEWQDRTVVTAAGGPRMKLRGVDREDRRAPNTWFYKGYQPVLGHVVVDGRSKLSPFNAVTTWQWVADDGAPVSADLVRHAWKTDNDRYRPEVVAALDADQDGGLSNAELVLDSSAKVALIRARLEQLGVRAPRIEGRIELEPVRHDVVSGKWVENECESCHAQRSRMNQPITLASGPFPGGVVPEPTDAAAGRLGGRTVVRTDDGLVLRGGAPPDHYVLGQSRRTWSDWLGFWLFVLALLGVIAHGSARYLTSRKKRGHAAAEPKRMYMYSPVERLWHWTMAVSVLVLLVSGFSISYPDSFSPAGMRSAVFAHNLFAVVLLVTAFLSMLVHVATGEIQQFIPKGAGLFQRLRIQIQYYLKGIFEGASHPFTKERTQKLNPLQQLTYAGLLNGLLPFQVVTGLLLWVAGGEPDTTRSIGGLSYIAPLHNLGSWLFLTFVVVHVYLTTTGHTPTSNLKAMVTGWDLTDAESDRGAAAPTQGENQ